jgi:transcriptional regulator with XRE-family HTH domain
MNETGTTQQQLADKIGTGTTRRTVSQYMIGEIEPKVRTLSAIAGYFGVSCDYMLGHTRAAAPDDFIQEAVRRYGLRESALRALESMNACCDSKQEISYGTSTAFGELDKCQQGECQIRLLSDLLSTPVTVDGDCSRYSEDSPYYTYAQKILSLVYDYLYREYPPLGEFDPDELRRYNLMELDRILAGYRTFWSSKRPKSRRYTGRKTTTTGI